MCSQRQMVGRVSTSIRRSHKTLGVPNVAYVTFGFNLWIQSLSQPTHLTVILPTLAQ